MPIEAINKIPEEFLWCANFNSKKSIETYGFAIRQFMNFLKIDNVNELRQVGHGHVIAFKKYLIDSLNKKPATVNNRLSAVSSDPSPKFMVSFINRHCSCIGGRGACLAA